MLEFMDAIVEYLSDNSELSTMLGENPAAGIYRIGAYQGDRPQELPYLSIRVSPSFPLSRDSNNMWTRSRVLLTAHSTKELICTKLIDLVENIARPSEIRDYMNISNDRIANSNTSFIRRWHGQQADKQFDKDKDVWMDMVELEMIWSAHVCRSNPYNIEIPYCPYAQDSRPGC